MQMQAGHYTLFRQVEKQRLLLLVMAGWGAKLLNNISHLRTICLNVLIFYKKQSCGE